MFSFFKKKKIIPLIKLNGIIGNVGKFKQGIDFSGQEEIITKAFNLKKSPAVLYLLIHLVARQYNPI